MPDYRITMTPDHRVPHVRNQEAAPPKRFRTLCGSRESVDGRTDVATSDGSEWSPEGLLRDGFYCRTCWRKAGWS